MAVDDREAAQEAAERTFAILTATYHVLPEREALIAELDADEARAVVKLMSALLAGTFTFAEKLERKPPGTVLPEIVDRLRRETPWMH